MQKRIARILPLLLIIIAIGCVYAAGPALAQLKVPNPLEGVDPTSPLSGVSSLTGDKIVTTIIGTFIKGALAVLGSLTVLVLFYGGFLWVINAGEEEKIKRGKQTVIWAALGVALIFGSYAAVDSILKIVAVGAGQQAAQTTAPEATAPRTPCEDAGNRCVELADCVGPASIPGCASAYATNLASAGELLVYMSDLSCGDNWKMACMKTVPSTSADLVPGDLKCQQYPATEYYCRSCQIVNADGSLTDGFCDREKKCQAGVPDPFKHPLCIGDRLTSGTGPCAEKQPGASCNVSTTVTGICTVDNTCISPCAGQNPGDICSHSSGRLGVCEAANGNCVLSSSQFGDACAATHRSDGDFFCTSNFSSFGQCDNNQILCGSGQRCCNRNVIQGGGGDVI